MVLIKSVYPSAYDIEPPCNLDVVPLTTHSTGCERDLVVVHICGAPVMFLMSLWHLEGDGSRIRDGVLIAREF